MSTVMSQRLLLNIREVAERRNRQNLDSIELSAMDFMPRGVDSNAVPAMIDAVEN